MERCATSDAKRRRLITAPSSGKQSRKTILPFVERLRTEEYISLRPCPRPRDRLPMTIRGAGFRTSIWLSGRSSEWAPPSRSSAADAYVCIMIEVLLDPPNTSSRHGSVLLEAGSTSAVIPTTTSVSACSRPSRYGLEAMERRVGPERRPTLTAPARADLRILWVGTKRRASRSNKETGDRKEEKVEFAARLALDFKNPIQV